MRTINFRGEMRVCVFMGVPLHHHKCGDAHNHLGKGTCVCLYPHDYRVSLCRWVSVYVSLSMSLCRRLSVAVAMSLSLCLCLFVYVSLSLSLCLCLFVAVSLSLYLSLSLIVLQKNMHREKSHAPKHKLNRTHQAGTKVAIKK